MGLNCLAYLIRLSKMDRLEAELGRLGQLAVKSLEAQDSEVRKSCVNLCVELNMKVGDEARLFETVLVGLGPGTQNLLTYYFAKGRRG